MISDLGTSISTISPESLDALFAGVPDNQVNADNINLTDSKVKVQEEKKDTLHVNTSANFNVENIDLDALEKEAEEKVEEKKEEKVEDKKEVEDKNKEENKEDKKEEKTSDEELTRTKELLKNSVDYLIKKGIFKDFKGREELDITDEVYAELLESQVEELVKERYDSKKNSTGEFGAAILEYIENGGEPDKLIDVFKERKAIEEFDTTTDDAKKDLVTKWYKEVHGWKSDKVKKYLTTLEAEDGLLDSEAEEIKTKYQEGYKQQLAELQQQQQQYKQQQFEKQKAFETNITKAIDTAADFDAKRQKFLKDSIFKFKTLDDGTKVNDFYVKFAEWQSDPSKYIELAEFVLDKEGYLKRKAIEVENKVVDKSFNFIKGNSTLTKGKGTSHIEKDKNPDENKPTDFSFFRNK